MRIAYLCSDVGVPVLGSKGCSVHVREITRALRNLGHDVRIYTPSPGVDAGVAEQAGVYSVPLEGLARRTAKLMKDEPAEVPAHLFSEFRRVLYAEQLKAKMRPILREFRPDAIYERYTLFGYTGIELAREFDVPLLLEVNAPLAEEGARRRGWILNRAAAAMEAEILQRADAVFVVSNAVGDHARSLGVPLDRIELLPNGVDPERFDPSVSGESVRRRYGLEDKIVLGYVGSLRVWHDLDTVIDAVNELVAIGMPVHFLPVGPGAGVQELPRRSVGNVTCPGAVRHERVPEYMAAMDLVLVPFGGDERYFSPMKLYEAMAMGKPIVAAQMGQIEELIEPSETGLLYEPGSAPDLARRIREMIARPDRGASLGNAARERVAQEHTWAARAGRITARIGSHRIRRAAG